MRIHADDRISHLTYCTNIHAADGWDDVLAGLRRHLPEIKRDVSPDAPLGVGLRLSARAAEALGDAAAFDALLELLADDYYVFTINGFPYGAFHGETVKEGAYRPDWSEAVRLTYSNRLADLMAKMLPDGLDGCISTVPGTFKPWAEGRVDAIADNLVRHAAHLVEVHRRSGKAISLAIEPEPYCLLETIDETIDFFEKHLFGAAAQSRLAELTGLSNADCEAALHRHFSVCYDVCHAAVEFEDPADSIAVLQRAGIAIGKLQLSSAMRIAEVGPSTQAQLRDFDEPVYLHQVVERRGGDLIRHRDLPEALAGIDAAAGAEWRIHFHVPIFLAEMENFGTTQDFLKDILALHRSQPVTEQLEVETYTWDVLPESYRNVGVSAAIARELNWVKDQLS